MVLETVLESLFAVVDIFFVAHLGADAIATVGLTESMMSLIYAVAIGLGIGASAVVARRIGEHDPSRASHAGGQAILLGVLVSLPISLIGLTFAPNLLGLLGASGGVQRAGSGYTRVLLGGNAAVLLLFLINAVFRGAGDAAIAMRSLWLASGCNMILGPLFIFGVGPFPRLGVTGAAVGTTIGRSIGVLYQIRQLARKRGLPPRRARARQPDSALRRRHPADPDRHGELARADPGPGRVRQQRPGRIHHRDPRGHLRASALVGPEQRRRDDGGTESRGQAAGARRAGRVDGCVLQHVGARNGRPGVRRVFRRAAIE